MSSYSTQQRKALLAYLSRHPDELLSARQIADALADEKISLSAVYRNLAQLEAEEKVRRSSKSGTRSLYDIHKLIIMSGEFLQLCPLLTISTHQVLNKNQR